MTHKIDQIDRRILHALQRDSSRSQRDLAEEVGLSQNALWRRLKALETAGVIQGYTARVAPEAVGAALAVFVMLRTRRHSTDWLRQFRLHVETIPEVVGFYRISGDYDYLLKIMASDMAAYDGVYQRLIRMEGLETVTSFFAMESIFDARPLPL